MTDNLNTNERKEKLWKHKKNKQHSRQLSNWQDYEEVRKGGKFNMFDPRACVSTGLSDKEYSFVMRNYSAMKAVVEAKEKK